MVGFIVSRIGFLQPHPSPAAILWDELDASPFKGGTDRGKGAGVRLALVGFKVRQR